VGHTIHARNRTAPAPNELQQSAPFRSGTTAPVILFSTVQPGILPLFEIGNSGTEYAADRLKSMPELAGLSDSNLTLERMDATLALSISIRDSAGAIIAELTRNVWKLQPSTLWDLNFDGNAAEVRNDLGYVVFQAQVLSNKVQIQGVMRSARGGNVALVVVHDPTIRGAIVVNRPISETVVPPIFAYPSAHHLGERVEAP
jgi:hypothetical protein